MFNNFIETPTEKLSLCAFLGKCGLLLDYRKLLKTYNNIEILFED